MLAERASQQILHVGRQPIEIDLLGDQGLPAREGQQPVRESRAALGRPQRLFDPGPGLGGQAAPLEIEIADDDWEQNPRCWWDGLGSS
jgi:hypothetical protein